MISLLQPCGSTVYIELENKNYLSDLIRFDPNAKETYYAKIQVRWPWGSFHHSYDLTRLMYGDARGLYLYKKQKEPIYTWKPVNIEEEYKHWYKDEHGYSIPLNEPRKIKKDLF